MFFHRKNIAPEIEDMLEEVRELLGLKPGISDIQVVYGLIPKDDTEIAMLTRSMLQIMVELATQVDVPQRHIEDGRTIPSIARDEGADDYLIRINNSKEKPRDAFIAVEYRDHWFWIDDRDLQSKRVFAFLMILFSLTETGGKEGLPLVTIPAG